MGRTRCSRYITQKKYLKYLIRKGDWKDEFDFTGEV